MKNQSEFFRAGRTGHLLFLLAFGFIFSVNESHAQEIREIGEYVQSSGFQSSDPFTDLRYGSGGILEISASGVVLPRNPSPQNVMVRSADLSSLPTEPRRYESVEFMQINMVDGASFSLDYSRLASFPGLRYILLVSSSPLSESRISQMMSGFGESGILILYQISRPG